MFDHSFGLYICPYYFTSFINLSIHLCIFYLSNYLSIFVFSIYLIIYLLLVTKTVYIFIIWIFYPVIYLSFTRPLYSLHHSLIYSIQTLETKENLKIFNIWSWRTWRVNCCIRPHWSKSCKLSHKKKMMICQIGIKDKNYCFTILKCTCLWILKV